MSMQEQIVDMACKAVDAATRAHVSAPAPEAMDLALAFDELQAWIARNPGHRSCWTIDRLKGRWRVGLESDGERFSASQDAELRGAIRNALMIAAMAGCQ